MMRIKNKQFFPLFVGLLLLIPIFIAAQERPEPNNQLVNCETGLAYQDFVVNEALAKTKDGEVLIVIARLGDGENSRELIRRRIYNVRQYFKDRGSRLAPEKVIVAEGERVKGYGRLEYYLGGEELYERLLFRKNGYICHSCCLPDERYYPEKEVYERQQKRKQKRKRRG